MSILGGGGASVTVPNAVSGTGTANQVTLWSGASTVTGDTGATWAGTGATMKFTLGGISVGGSAASGTGIYLSAANVLGFVTNGVEKWVINSSGAFNPTIDATYDIGTSLVRPRDLTISRNLVAGGTANRIGTATTADALADTLLATSATTQKGLVVQAKTTTPSAHVFEIQASDGTVECWGGYGGGAWQWSAPYGVFGTQVTTPSVFSAAGYFYLTSSGLSFKYANSQVIDWGTAGTPNVGLSYISTGVLGVGNGTAGDASGTLQATTHAGPGTFTTLTESAATGFATLTFSASKAISAEFLCLIEANDGTDYQSLTSRVRVSSVRKSTGNTVSAVNVVGTDLLAESAGGSTLTCTFTVTEGATACTLNANATSSLAQTTLRISFLAETVGPVTIAKL